VRDDRRRPARPDPVDFDVHVPAGLRVLQAGLRRGDRLDPVHPRGDRGRGPDPRPAVGGVAMTAELQSTPAPIRPLPRGTTPDPRSWFTPKSIVVYVLLFFGLLAMIGPFLWMLLGSFKEQG